MMLFEILANLSKFDLENIFILFKKKTRFIRNPCISASVKFYRVICYAITLWCWVRVKFR